MSAGSAPSSSLWIDAIEARSNLTRSQFLIWMGQQLAPSSPLYNMVFAFAMRGPLEVERWCAAYARLCEQCEALRTVVTVEDGVPQQRVLDASPVTLERIDLRAGGEEACKQWIDTHARAPLMLGEALGESALLRLGEHEHVWFLKLHHVITDAWSTALLCERLAALYDGQVDVEPLPSYADHLARERAAREKAQAHHAASYWQAQLSNPVEPLHFYASAHRAGNTSRTRRLTLPLGDARTR
ncbi:MAG: condensation domain-containing protein, partial [Pseudomonadota bacterium]